MKLIEMEKVLSELCLSHKDIIYIDKNETAERIRKIPSIDIEPKRGEWIDRSDGGRILNPWWETYECSKCGQYGTRIWHFCPNCGADMRERKESE